MGEGGEMNQPRPRGLAEVACRNCGLQVAVTTAIIRMGASDLFACPRCNHQEVWRNAAAGAEPVGASSRGGAL